MSSSTLDGLIRVHEQLVRQHLTAENNHLLAETLATLHELCVFEDITLGKTYTVNLAQPSNTKHGGTPLTTK